MAVLADAAKAAAQNLTLEQADACGHWSPDGFADQPEMLEALSMAQEPTGILEMSAGAKLPGNGKVLKAIPGMGKVYDWRTSPWTPANGGRITPLVCVQHIPVVPNMAGIADFVRLRDVLVAQGLMVQAATDREGNVALFTPFDVLCFQARGGNQQSFGIEHMHATTAEDWTKRQLRACAWVMQLAERKHGISTRRGRLEPGPGVIRVARRGSVGHRDVSAKAGFNDRSDPGDKFWDRWSEVRAAVRFFEAHGHFKGA